jgi:uncharacterized protein (DUF305 family)
MVHSAPRHVLACLLTTTLLGVSACGDSGSAGARATPAAATTPAGAAGSFGGTDLAWVEINIAMDEQLLPLLELAPTHGANPAVRSLAAEVKAFHADELGSLRQLRDQAKLPTENPHEGMLMPGMVSAEEVAKAKTATAAAFDALLLKDLRAHFEQGVSLATSERKAGVEPQTLALAQRVLAHRAGYLPKVKALAAG